MNTRFFCLPLRKVSNMFTTFIFTRRRWGKLGNELFGNPLWTHPQWKQGAMRMATLIASHLPLQSGCCCLSCFFSKSISFTLQIYDLRWSEGADRWTSYSISAPLIFQIVSAEKRVKACRSTIHIHLSLEFDLMSDRGTWARGAAASFHQEKKIN